MWTLTCNIDRKITTGQWILAAPTASWCRRDVHNQEAKKNIWPWQLASWPSISIAFDRRNPLATIRWAENPAVPLLVRISLQSDRAGRVDSGFTVARNKLSIKRNSFSFPPHISLPPDGWRSIRTVSRRNGAQPSKKKKNTSSEAHTRADFMAHEIKQPAEYIWGGRLRLPATWHWLNYSGHAKGLRTAHTHTRWRTPKIFQQQTPLEHQLRAARPRLSYIQGPHCGQYVIVSSHHPVIPSFDPLQWIRSKSGTSKFGLEHTILSWTPSSLFIKLNFKIPAECVDVLVSTWFDSRVHLKRKRRSNDFQSKLYAGPTTNEAAAAYLGRRF